jgi:hypothetical protein
MTERKVSGGLEGGISGEHVAFLRFAARLEEAVQMAAASSS